MKIFTKVHRCMMVVFLLLVGVVIAKFTAPNANERDGAVGVLVGLPAEMKRAFSNKGEFAVIPDPGPGDWLSQHE